MVLVTLAEAEEVISRPKFLTQDMVWKGKHNKVKIDWLESRMLIQFSGEFEVPEQLLVICEWKKRIGRRSEKWTFSLLYQDIRIYALDFHPDDSHKNNKGVGRKMYQSLFYGAHEHTYSEDGYGYAEPISLDPEKPGVMWEIFSKRAGIEKVDFNHPDQGEPELPL